MALGNGSPWELAALAWLEVSIAAAGQKLAAMDQMTARHQVTRLGMLGFRPAVGRSSGAAGRP